MRRVFGPRTAIEAVFLVVVPVAVLIAGQGPAVIIASSAVAYLGVIVFEMLLWRSRPQPSVAAQPVQPAVAPAETVRVLPAKDAAPEQPAPEPVPVAAAEPQPAPEPEPEAAPEPAPATPVLASVPDLEPLPAAEPEPEPTPMTPEAAPVVVPIGVSSAPRQWNLWDLERLTREDNGRDAVLDEERSFLLMYLRDFAGPDGLLPIDFDGLVRDSFGDLVNAR